MTDNEKRAHDIAVCLLPILYKLKVDQAIKDEQGDLKIDFHKMYMDTYTKELEAINRSFS